MKKNYQKEEKITNSMLKLVNIKKDYSLGSGNDVVHALKGISISFRKNEFVSILGPSGCGKTTLLNIIGGLDKYTDGDLIISGKSTKTYSDRDWDVYRNHRIGFIFQSYNLIPHQTILGNVELALTIAGLNKKERIEKAKKALDKVGLSGMYNKHPNQLSGGQCQRVAIARALVNEPEILLADEPTGALDTVTSVQIMDLIKEISKEKLVIMVTHNPDLADQYSTRIVRLLDGELQSDSNPFVDELIENKHEVVVEKAKMSFATAFKLSLRNLQSKFKRTVLVCIAGSIGIVGVSSVLAVSNGIRNYIDSMQDDMLSGNPITVSETAFDLSGMMNQASTAEKVEILQEAGYVNVNSMIKTIAERTKTMNSYTISNTITQDYIDYVNAMDSSYYAAIDLDYGVDVRNNIYTNWKLDGTSSTTTMSLSAITQMYTSVLETTEFKDYVSYISQLSDTFAQAPNNEEYIESQYDLLSGKVATEKDEIMIVVSRNRQLNDVLLAQLGYYTQQEFINVVYESFSEDLYDESIDKSKFSYNELLGQSFTYYLNDTVFEEVDDSILTKSMNPFTYKAYKDDSFTNGVELKVVGILQPKDSISYGCLDTGFYYTSALTDYIIENNSNSNIINYYSAKNLTSISSGPYTTTIAGTSYTTPTGITYKYNYYDGTNWTNDVDGYVGSESSVNSYLSIISSMMGGGSSALSSAKYYTITTRELGGIKVANKVTVYPTNFAYKDNVTKYLDDWNSDQDITLNGTVIKASDRKHVTYTDNLSIIIALINTMIDIVTTALICFTALSLLVSTVMIGIITYVSVVERVKEIGVIRSLGGRKKDVSHLFNAETFILGLASGIFGILFTLFLSLIINVAIKSTIDYPIASLSIRDAIIMIIVSIVLTLISGLIPAKAAANKNPVDALRTE